MIRGIHCLLVGLVAIASTSVVVSISKNVKKNDHESIKSAKINQTQELRNEIRINNAILATKIEWTEHEIERMVKESN